MNTSDEMNNGLKKLREALHSMPSTPGEVRELAQGLGESAIELLVEEVKTGDWWPSKNAAVALAGLSPVPLVALASALRVHYVDVREIAIQTYASVGEPALTYLAEGLQDESCVLREIAVQGLADIGTPAISALGEALRNDHLNVRKIAARALAGLDSSGYNILQQALRDSSPGVRVAVAPEIGNFGAVALQALANLLADEDSLVRQSAVVGLSAIGEQALDSLGKACDDTDIEVRRQAAFGLCEVGKPAYEHLLHVLEDESAEVRIVPLEQLSGPGIYDDWRLSLFVLALEDSSRRVRVKAIDTLADHSLHEGDWSRLVKPSQAILEHHIVRGGTMPNHTFSAGFTAHAINRITSSDPQSIDRVLGLLCDIAFQNVDDIRDRAVGLARELNTGRFASIVKARASEDESAALDIMDKLGGSEASAYFSKLQAKALAEYREPLVDLEKKALERWESLTRGSRRSARVSRGLSIALFVIGSGFVVTTLAVLILSAEPWKQVAAALGSLGTFLAMYSKRFWQAPVEQISKLSNEQARLQTAFIGYMNRIAQQRLVFESQYSAGDMSLDDLERYQNLIRDAVDQASRQITVSADLVEQ